MKHDWKWIGQAERRLGGNSVAVDIYQCRLCGQAVEIRGSSAGPAEGQCRRPVVRR